ncbi:MAG: ABC transporter permease [Actinobacteria bacterium]|nr:ABC transporter permease [Actinomycetota bacterium]
MRSPELETPTPPVIGCRVATPMTPLLALGDIAAVTRRYITHFWRVPQLLVFSIIQPIMFVLLFRYVFGGAIKVPQFNYVDYLMPGIFVQTALFGGAGTSIGLAFDLKGGIIDRFRTLPMARSAVLAGRTTADLFRNVMVIVIMLIVGTLVGFRFHGGIADDLLGVLLVLAFGYAFSWLYATIGLLVKDPETAQTAAFLPLFPLVFASSAFVPVNTMPSWLQAFAKHQPVSLAVNSCRALFNNEAAWGYLWQLLIWIVAMCVIFIPLAVRAYRRV